MIVLDMETMVDIQIFLDIHLWNKKNEAMYFHKRKKVFC